MNVQLPHVSKKMAAWATSIVSLMALAKGRPEMTGVCAILIAIVTVCHIIMQGIVDCGKEQKK